MSTQSSELARARIYFPDSVYDEILFMKDSGKVKQVIDAIDKFVKSEGKSITTSQLRNIFAKIKTTENPQKLQLIRPLLAYAAARQGTQGAKIIISLLDDLIQKAEDEDHLESFKTFMESIVAYHKFYYNK